MAFDGISLAAVIDELDKKLTGGRIDKVYQPEGDEIILSIRSLGSAYKLLLTANPSNPKLHLTDANKNNPMTPPLFCMVLRKHIQSGKLIRIEQPNFERIVNIYIESMNEMGDYSIKKLVLEIMGRHSNLILVDEDGTILDSIKHIGHDKSSVREVLPGRQYFMPPSQDKLNTLEISRESFMQSILSKPASQISAAIYKGLTGISPISASELCFRAGIDPSTAVESLFNNEISNIYDKLEELTEQIKGGDFCPNMIYDQNNKIIDFVPFKMQQFSKCRFVSYDSMSSLIEDFYAKRDFVYRMNQKTIDLRHLISQNIERCVRKKDIQRKTLKDIKNRDTLRLYGELITANIYMIKKGMNTVEVYNFYSEENELVKIELDPNLTPSENAQKYFKAYNKAKRTFEALQEQIKSNDDELKYLEGVLTNVDNCVDEQDIKQIRQELSNEGYIKRIKSGKEKQKGKSSKGSVPMHYISCDGFDIYVGKNNIQNDELTLKTAKKDDIWLHTKDIPGSHVIIVADGRQIPDSTINDAVMLAAWYSKGKNSTKVAVDYTQKRNVKKPNGAKPGFVIYETNKTAYVDPSETEIEKIKSVK